MLADSAATYLVSTVSAVVALKLEAKGSRQKHPLVRNQQATTASTVALVGSQRTTMFLAVSHIRIAVVAHFVKVAVAVVSETRTTGSKKHSHQYFAAGDMCLA